MANYIHTYSDKEQGRLFRQGKILENIVFNFFDLNGYQKIIELGCGNGGNTKILLERNLKGTITAVDINEVSIKQAISKTEPNPRLQFEQGNIYDLKYNDNTFDCAFICWVLEHLEDPQKAVNEAFRILQKGGHILITEVYNRSFYLYPDQFPALMEYYGKFNELQIDMKGFPDIGIQVGNLLTNAGFKNVKLQNKTIIYDKRNIQQRNEMLDYFIELMFSAKEVLIKEKLIDPELILEIKKELELFKKDESAIFYYAPVQAIGEK